tara:strand:- start:57 stop:245 length:189 start_codon:yes stop_codon:yes gene_type:complete
MIESMEIQTTAQALEMALTLAITAPTEAKVSECIILANRLAQSLPQEAIDAAMLAAEKRATA